jgi:NCS1 family nucleobase:cation symporter-1
MPWKLIESSHGYIFTWLVAYSALLGAIGGILICDYWVLRRTRVSVKGLFDPNGQYSYDGGTNWRAVVALVVAVLPCLPGFINLFRPGEHHGFFDHVYNYAWFVTFFLAFVLYWLMSIGNAETAQS